MYGHYDLSIVALQLQSPSSLRTLRSTWRAVSVHVFQTQ